MSGGVDVEYGWTSGIKLEPKVRCSPLQALPPLEVQEVHYLSHCFSSRPDFFQSIQAITDIYPPELYKNCSNLRLHINYSFARVDYRGHWAPPGSSKLDYFPVPYWAEWPKEPLKRTSILKCKSTLCTGRRFCDVELGMLALTLYHQSNICAYKLRMEREGGFPR